MAYQQPYPYSNQDGYDTSFNPPSRNPYHSPPGGNDGYHVASVSSYLPPTERSLSPSTLADDNAQRYAPPLASLNPYHQFQARRQQDLTALGISRGNNVAGSTASQDGPSREDGHQRMSAYRQQRQTAAAGSDSTIATAYQQQTARLQTPPVHRKLPGTILQNQAQRVEAPIALGSVPALPTNTRLNYGSGDGGRSEGGVSALPQTNPFAGPGEEMTNLASAATAALNRGKAFQSALQQRARPLPTQPARTPLVASQTSQTSNHKTVATPYTHDNSSLTGLLPAAAPPALVPPMHQRRNSAVSGISRSRSPLRSEYSYGEPGDSSYAPSLQPPNRTTALGVIDPLDIADDDDDPFTVLRPDSKQSKHSTSKRHGFPATVVGGGGLLKSFGARDTSGSYGQVPGGGPPDAGLRETKSPWLSKQTRGNNRLRWLVGIFVVLVVVCTITGIVLAPVLKRVLGHSSSSGTSSTGSTTSAGLLTASSSEIKALLSNKNLHKVFPGMDYTPLNSQYPDCLSNPPSQNNITKDIAILSQLTPLIRLYGTDCNVTSMVLESLSLLNLDASHVKLMPGVWLNGNSTTNTRQIDQLYSTLKPLSTNQKEQIAGVMVGNEVLFAAYLTAAELISTISSVRANLSTIGYAGLPIGTAELGSQWTATLVDAVDIVGANVHPFFAGVTASVAATWTYAYWQTTDVSLSASNASKINVIAETGWPTEGGYFEGSTAGVPELNAFMEDWVCAALGNGTRYWWFEAFDEAWKVRDDTNTTTDGKVETHWGLFEAGSWSLKSNVTVPSCGGKTAASWI